MWHKSIIFLKDLFTHTNHVCTNPIHDDDRHFTVIIVRLLFGIYNASVPSSSHRNYLRTAYISHLTSSWGAEMKGFAEGCPLS